MGNNLGIRQEIAGELMGTSGYESYFLEIINLINLERFGLVQANVMAANRKQA